MSFLAFALALTAQPAHPAHTAHPQPTPAAAPAAAQAGGLSITSTKISDLLANPAAKAILDKHLPGFSSHPSIGMAGGLTLKGVQQYAQGQITDAHLQAIQAELAALPAS